MISMFRLKANGKTVIEGTGTQLDSGRDRQTLDFFHIHLFLSSV